MKYVLIYLGIGLVTSLKTAPLSWEMLLQGKGAGNLPIWLFAWPWPYAAQGVKMVTGKYPSWTPNL